MQPHSDADTPNEQLKSEQLSEFEFTLITYFYGFLRWVEKCMDATDIHGLKALDILVLHAANDRARGSSPNQIATALNIDDVHLVSYSIKKLVAADLVTSVRQGRNHGYEATPVGAAACTAYSEVRQKYLLSNLQRLRDGRDEIVDATQIMRVLTGMYDQAGRFAVADAAMARQKPSPPVRTKR